MGLINLGSLTTLSRSSGPERPNLRRSDRERSPFWDGGDGGGSLFFFSCQPSTAANLVDGRFIRR